MMLIVKKMYRNIKSLGSCIKKNPGNLTFIHQFRILKKKYKNLLNVKRSLLRDKLFSMLEKIEKQ